jgi:hypothetical protein
MKNVKKAAASILFGFVLLPVMLAGCFKKQDVVSQPEERDDAALLNAVSQEDGAVKEFYQYNIDEDGGIIEIIAYYGDAVDITIPDGVTHIGSEVFMDRGIVSVVFPESLVEIGDFAFSDNMLSEVKLPDGLTYIGERAFFNNNLGSIVIPDSVTSIETFAFVSNPITYITIGENVDLVSVEVGGYLGKTYVFDNEFDDFYEANGKKAENYEYYNWQWIFSK